MAFIQVGLGTLLIVFLYIVTIRIYMEIANYIGEKLGIGKFIIKLFEKDKHPS